MDYLRYFQLSQIKATNRPQLRAGDIIRVNMKITEGDKERIQPFEGTVLGVRGTGPSVTFTVRREIGRFAVERIFPLYSPLITNIEIVQRQKIRRAKLTYLRQAGHRRVKEDSKSMQWHMKAEEEKRRLAEESKKRAEDKKRQEEIEAKRIEDAKARAQEEAPAAAAAEADKENPEIKDALETSAKTSETNST